MTPINLKECWGKLYVVRDDGTDDPDRSQRPWCMEIPARYGAIYPYGDVFLAVRCESLRVSSRLARLGYRVVQAGDFETVFLFPPKEIARVAAIIQAKKRRQLSQEQRAKRAAVMARVKTAVGQWTYRAVSTSQAG